MGNLAVGASFTVRVETTAPVALGSALSVNASGLGHTPRALRVPLARATSTSFRRVLGSGVEMMRSTCLGLLRLGYGSTYELFE